MWPFNDLDDPVYIKTIKNLRIISYRLFDNPKSKCLNQEQLWVDPYQYPFFTNNYGFSRSSLFFSVPGFQWSWWYVFMVLPNSDQSKFVVPPEENQHQFQNARGPNFGSQLSEITFYFEKNRKFWEHLEENYWLARARKASSQKLTNLEFGLSHFAIFLTKIW